MSLLHNFLAEHAEGVVVRLEDGSVLEGRIVAHEAQWLLVERGVEGQQLVSVAHIVSVCSAQELLARQPQSADRPRRASRLSPGRRWEEDELKALANGFLDGTPDNDLAEQFHRTRAVIKELHAAFECARGNVNEDDLGPVAKTWVGRWMRVLAG